MELDKIVELKCINYLCKRVSDTLICYGYHLSIDCCRKYITDEKISDCNLDKINYMTLKKNKKRITLSCKHMLSNIDRDVP